MKLWGTLLTLSVFIIKTVTQLQVTETQLKANNKTKPTNTRVKKNYMPTLFIFITEESMSGISLSDGRMQGLTCYRLDLVFSLHLAPAVSSFSRQAHSRNGPGNSRIFSYQLTRPERMPQSLELQPKAAFGLW